jgi:hypothetical protein
MFTIGTVYGQAFNVDFEVCPFHFIAFAYVRHFRHTRAYVLAEKAWTPGRKISLFKLQEPRLEDGLPIQNINSKNIY